ncbi:ANTAR domain-containing protein [Amycolatopsis sp. NPDC051903]|uniref:ANTAR domain-containing protein n=1 Tax=Amycolatopsis sp. NPDC051903 TaxID=3363936 RepID=UPI0037A2B4F3
MTDLTEALETGDDTASTLEAVCTHAVRAVPGAEIASVTVITDGEPETAAYTDEIALRVDRAQYATGDGPCLRAAATGEIVRMSLPHAGREWPDFVAFARGEGIGSYLAAPLRVDDTLTGALNLFSTESHGFEELDGKVLELYTVVVASGLRTTRRFRRAHDLAAHLDTAMRNRAVIEQAKGILMAAHRISDVEAMQRLVRESQNTNVKLREVAIRFVREATRPAG